MSELITVESSINPGAKQKWEFPPASANTAKFISSLSSTKYLANGIVERVSGSNMAAPTIQPHLTHSSPASAGASASATQVFSTPELLEMIFLQVSEDDLRTVFLSRRVNNFFKATIEGSVHLQRALFLRCDVAHPTVEEESGLRVNPLFDITDRPQTKRYIEAYNFGLQYVQDVGFDPGSLKAYSESVDIWCEDVILELCEGPLVDMVLLEKREGTQLWFQVGVYFRLRRGDGQLPEAVRVPVDFEEWKQITVGELVTKARRKLGEWYPEYYGDSKTGEAA
ncbi:hypothetical protein M409DRAFT_58173 [Zasmidium cellare ATCC 36951]|uniref:F-box domain-containing protein n=1 Tax=Zasmidium cellare ATCC 36951 TaxID=1080233 RepID=A0A6A6C962_ZASCE|nr:uncharacterized protein M409DRAFT_58173 [Zasmidium cellare ATCC 36951]KAF2162780.1 hypothetical protein M409DRAFT_58173 [Zasmidium cellare ATCC 36951]